MNNNTLIIGGTVLLALVLGVFVFFGDTTEPIPSGTYDEFAQCIKDSGTTFFGAFWCPHCQAQKAMFGSSARLLPYVECSTPDGEGRLQVCIDEGIESYPTWEYPDGTRQSGEVPLVTLAEKTGCTLPE